MLTFDELLSRTPFVGDMREMLGVLQEAYDYPVDIEFTANFPAPDHYKINLVQCRPLQVAADGGAVRAAARRSTATIAFSKPTAR